MIAGWPDSPVTGQAVAETEEVAAAAAVVEVASAPALLLVLPALLLLLAPLTAEGAAEVAAALALLAACGIALAESARTLLSAVKKANERMLGTEMGGGARRIRTCEGASEWQYILYHLAHGKVND